MCKYRLQCYRRHHVNNYFRIYINGSTLPILESLDSCGYSKPHKAKSCPKLISTLRLMASALVLGGSPLLHTWYVFLYQCAVSTKINTKQIREYASYFDLCLFLPYALISNARYCFLTFSFYFLYRSLL